MSECRLILGDCLEVLRGMDVGCVDAVVTDPPAGISFMGKEWDSFGKGPPRRPNGEECRASYGPASRFKGTGTPIRYREVERASFLAFLTPRMAECLRVLKPGGYALVWAIPRTSHWTATALEDAGFEVRDRLTHLFAQGFPKGKSCLKPAAEDWWLVRKPAPRVAPLNIDGCRIAYRSAADFEGAKGGDTASNSGGEFLRSKGAMPQSAKITPAGRWPANVCLSHHDLCNGDCHPECPVRLLDEQAGEWKTGGPQSGKCYVAQPGGWFGGARTISGYTDAGGPSRFFFCPKAGKKDRGEGNGHPTVKPQALMEWLVTLISQSGDMVLDPFMGSGTTGLACQQTGRNFIGIEISSEYHALAQRRLAEVCKPDLFGETHLIVEGQPT